MSADDLDPRLRSRLRAELERVEPPSPRWATAAARDRALQPSQTRPLVLLVAAAAIAVAGGAIALAGGRLPIVPPGPTLVPSPVASAALESPSAAPKSAEPSTPAISPSPVASPSQEPLLIRDQPWRVTGSSGGWTTTLVPTDRSVSGIADVGGGLVLGETGTEPTLPSGRPAVWRLGPSGFSLETLPLASSHLSMLTPTVATTDGTRIVVGGGGGTDLCAHPFAGGNWAWDGTAWAAKPFVEAVDCSAIPTAIVHGPLGFVETTMATGEVYGIWRSSDGLAWAKVAPPEPGFLQLTSVAVIAGRYVVGGRGSDGSAMVWSTSDLRTWRRTVLSPATTGDLPSVVASSTLGVAFSARSDGTVARWTSRDGATWSLISQTLPTVPTSGIWVAGDRFVMAGPVGSKSAIWWSTDAQTWHWLLLPPTVSATASIGPVGVLGSELVVVVSLDDGPNSRQQVLIRPWPSP